MNGEKRGWGYFERFLDIYTSAESQILCDGQLTSNGCESEVLDVWCDILPARGMIVVLNDMNDILDSEHSCLSALQKKRKNLAYPQTWPTLCPITEQKPHLSSATKPSISSRLTIKQHNIQRLLDFQRSVQHNQPERNRENIITASLLQEPPKRI